MVNLKRFRWIALILIIFTGQLYVVGCAKKVHRGTGQQESQKPEPATAKVEGQADSQSNVKEKVVIPEPEERSQSGARTAGKVRESKPKTKVAREAATSEKREERTKKLLESLAQGLPEPTESLALFMGSRSHDAPAVAKKKEKALRSGSRMQPSAHHPSPYTHPFTGLRVINDKPFYDMYFKHYGVNPTIDTDEENFSTFSVDVDTASYTMARSYLERGHLPDEAAIRVEEFVNAFDYNYTPPTEEAFSILAEAFPSPNRKGYHVLHVGLKGKDVRPENRKPANLVFVIDTSGSMNVENRLGLVKKALGYLVDQLDDQDSVGIVAYGHNAYEVLKPTSGRNKSVIFQAINNLRSTGSTNAQAGIHLGYQMAARYMKEGGVNRIILCSDGVANNGIATGVDAIFDTIRDKVKKGITISTIGFGMANYNDVLMERLADIGDGNYHYVDRIEQAKRVFVENLTGLLQVIAKDVKIQVEFDTNAVSRYRLIGYENRHLKKEDFANDRIDAGEIGAGHSVTAIYEVKFKKEKGYFGTLRIRHKEPEGGASKLIEKKLPFSIVRASFEKASPATRLSMVTVAFAEKLRGSYWTRNLSYENIIKLYDGIGAPLNGRKDVVALRDLITRAKGLDNRDDKFIEAAPVAMMDFDSVPILRQE